MPQPHQSITLAGAAAPRSCRRTRGITGAGRGLAARSRYAALVWRQPPRSRTVLQHRGSHPGADQVGDRARGGGRRAPLLADGPPGAVHIQALRTEPRIVLAAKSPPLARRSELTATEVLDKTFRGTSSWRARRAGTAGPYKPPTGRSQRYADYAPSARRAELVAAASARDTDTNAACLAPGRGKSVRVRTVQMPARLGRPVLEFERCDHTQRFANDLEVAGHGPGHLAVERSTRNDRPQELRPHLPADEPACEPAAPTRCSGPRRRAACACLLLLFSFVRVHSRNLQR